MPRKAEARVNQKNGSKYFTLNRLVDRFFKSRFNRDNLHDAAEGEDVNNSKLYRLYNKQDLLDISQLFAEFFEWVLNEENISRLYISNDLTLIRESTLPRVKYATPVDEMQLPGECKAGEYYITRGRYIWRMWVEGETFEKMKELSRRDPEFIKIREELIPEMEEKNKNVRERSKDKPAS